MERPVNRAITPASFSATACQRTHQNGARWYGFSNLSSTCFSHSQDFAQALLRSGHLLCLSGAMSQCLQFAIRDQRGADGQAFEGDINRTKQFERSFPLSARIPDQGIQLCKNHKKWAVVLNSDGEDNKNQSLVDRILW